MATDSSLLLALTTFVCGFMMRDHLQEIWGKLKADLPILLDAACDLFLVAVLVVGCVVLAAVGLIVLIYVALNELRLLLFQMAKALYPMLLAILRFIRKWWWVPVGALVAYLFTWWATTTMQGVTVTPTFLSFVAFLVAVVLVFFLVRMIMTKVPMLVLFLLGVFALHEGLMILSIVGANFYGLMLLLGSLIGFFLGLLASIASVIMKWVAVALLVLAVLLSSLIPSCGDNLAIKIPQMGPEAPAEIKKEVEERVPPYTVTARAVAQDGDGCISMLDRLGIAEADAKLLLDTDRLSWCVAKAHEAGRVVYWHSDPKRWMAPKVCMKKVPGRVTQHEEWMLVTLQDGRSSVIMPPDSPLCTPRP